MFVDDVTIEVAAGKGGNGCSSLLRQKYKPKGGPDGGDGGSGGNVYVVNDEKLNSLQNYKSRKTIRARDGNPGMKLKCHGKNGADIEIPVPPGTVVMDEDSGEALGEISLDLARLLVARGGRGGRGNQHFATSRNRAPHRADEGSPGEKRSLRLACYIRADAALVGLANSGKSALATALADTDFDPPSHPFSTRHPTPLTCELAPWLQAVLLDLPSVRLPGDAREGENRYLRQLRNPRILIYTLDAASEIAPDRQLKILRDAVFQYDERYREKKEIAVVTRTDLAAPGAGHEKESSRPENAIPVSIKNSETIDSLRAALAEALENE
ncbi:MAG: GTPase [bacterium]